MGGVGGRGGGDSGRQPARVPSESRPTPGWHSQWGAAQWPSRCHRPVGHGLARIAAHHRGEADDDFTNGRVSGGSAGRSDRQVLMTGWPRLKPQQVDLSPVGPDLFLTSAGCVAAGCLLCAYAYVHPASLCLSVSDSPCLLSSNKILTFRWLGCSRPGPSIPPTYVIVNTSQRSRPRVLPPDSPPPSRSQILVRNGRGCWDGQPVGMDERMV
jgi:hypothetical protein